MASIFGVIEISPVVLKTAQSEGGGERERRIGNRIGGYLLPVVRSAEVTAAGARISQWPDCVHMGPLG